ncbi:MAG: nitroreductase family protein [Nocardioidaceae bacterium]
MEFQDAVRRRRMIRNYAPDAVDSQALDRILANALRAPSAGFSQGWGFLALDTAEDVARFWSAASPPSESEGDDSWLRGMKTAPVVIVAFSNKDAYLDRYAEDDKGWTDRDEARWPVPYWHTDTAMAVMLMLLTVVDEGLGACYFGVPPERHDALRDAFGVPAHYTAVGAVTVGHRVPDAGTKGSAKRGRRTDVIHRGRWGS